MKALERIEAAQTAFRSLGVLEYDLYLSEIIESYGITIFFIVLSGDSLFDE